MKYPRKKESYNFTQKKKSSGVISLFQSKIQNKLQMKDQNRPTAIVVGAGPAGLSVSLGLSNRGWNVVLIEKYNSFEVRGASFGMAPNGIKALEEIHPGIVEDKFMKTGRGIQTPHGGILIPWWMMRDALLEQVLDQSETIDLKMGLLIENIEDEGDMVLVRFSDGTHIEGNLVIGADGVHSSVRQILGLPQNEFTGTKIFRGTVEVQINRDDEDEKNGSTDSSSLLEPLLDKGMVPLSATYPGVFFFVINFHPHIEGRMCWVFSTTDPDFDPKETSVRTLFERNERDEEKLSIIKAFLDQSAEESLLSCTKTKVTDFSDGTLSKLNGRWGGKVSDKIYKCKQIYKYKLHD